MEVKHGQRKAWRISSPKNLTELLSYFQVEAPIHRPSFFSIFFTYDKR
jgi:hypothetical protein